MKSLLTQLQRAIDSRTPGTALNIALEKRALQKKLQAEGYSRKHAMAVVSDRFRGRA